MTNYCWVLCIYYSGEVTQGYRQSLYTGKIHNTQYYAMSGYVSTLVTTCIQTGSCVDNLPSSPVSQIEKSVNHTPSELLANCSGYQLQWSIYQISYVPMFTKLESYVWSCNILLVCWVVLVPWATPGLLLPIIRAWSRPLTELGNDIWLITRAMIHAYRAIQEMVPCFASIYMIASHPW